VVVLSDLSPMDALKLIELKEALVVDVRTFQEYAQGRIQGAACIPVDEITLRARELLADKNKPVLVYCRSGSRSAYAANALQAIGYSKVFNLAGGILAWQKAGLELSL